MHTRAQLAELADKMASNAERLQRCEDRLQALGDEPDPERLRAIAQMTDGAQLLRLEITVGHPEDGDPFYAAPYWGAAIIAAATGASQIADREAYLDQREKATRHLRPNA